LFRSVSVWNATIMNAPVEHLVDQAQADFAQASDLATLENAKARYLGRQGAVTTLLKGLAGVDPAQRREQGAHINQIKKQIETLLQQRRQELADAALNQRL